MTPEEQTLISRLFLKVDEMAKVMATSEDLKTHIEYTKESSDRETQRVDAIHEEDTRIRTEEKVEAASRAKTLADQVEMVARTLRELVETTRSAATKSQAELINPIITRLDEIEKKQYENQGKTSLTDPMLTTLVAKMETVATTLSEGKGRSGLSSPLLMMIAGLGGGLLVYIVQTLMVVRP